MSFNPAWNTTSSAFGMRTAALSVTGATSATLNRLHVISGTSADYDITISGLNPVIGDFLGFQVTDFSAARYQYRLDAGGTVKIFGRTRYLILLHGNSIQLRWDGTDWQAVTSDLTTKWVAGNSAGTTTINLTATSVNPVKGTTTRDEVRWRRISESIEIVYDYKQTAAGSGTTGTGDYLYGIPIGVINTTQAPTETGATSAAVRAEFGYARGSMQTAATERANPLMGVYDSTHLRIAYSSATIQSSINSPMTSTTMRLILTASLPMIDW